jgi:uncharacterized RDD family membrane protein YckC
MSPRQHSRQDGRQATDQGGGSEAGARPRLLDSYREVVTPEGVALQLPAAGPVPRALAWIIDLLVRSVIMATIGMFMGLLGNFGLGLYLVALFLVFWGYPILFEAMWHGQTPGKRVLDLRVLAADGAPAGWLAVIVRNLLRSVDMLPLAYAAGLVSCLCDRDGRRLGDLVADTVVVHSARRVQELDVPKVAPLAAGQPLRAEDQAAIVAFAERSSRMPPARQVELAALLQPLGLGVGMDGVRQLLGIANGLLGRR